MGDSDSSDFCWSVQNGDLETVKQCVAKCGDLVNATIGTSGRYPLHIAADYGQTDVIEYLLSKGADINIVDKHGITPLLAAIYEGHTKSVELLIKKGAKRDGKGPDGSSYIDIAEKQEIKDLLK